MTILTDTIRAKLVGLFANAGATPIELPVLYHSDLFVDLIGEDIRRRLYVAPGANGEMMAMRPDFTIPACLHHLAHGEAGRTETYGYVGPVFRQRTDGQPGEFHQAGIESINPDGGVAFDASSVQQAVEAVISLSGQKPVVAIGDRALFSALLSALETPVVWRRRLEGAFGDRAVLDKMLARLGSINLEGEAPASGLARLLDGKAPDDVRDAVEEMLAIAGLATVGGRSVDDIAERYIEKAQLAAKAGWDAEKLDCLNRFLAISGTATEALASLKSFDAEENGCLGAALATFEARLEAIGAILPDGTELQFRADFGRRLDYYSGFNFELYFHGARKPVAGGGRYDSLLGLLSPQTDDGDEVIKAVPAIGFAIWLDRLCSQSSVASQ